MSVFISIAFNDGIKKKYKKRKGEVSFTDLFLIDSRTKELGLQDEVEWDSTTTTPFSQIVFLRSSHRAVFVG